MAAPLYFFARRSRADVVDGDRLRTSLLAEAGLSETFADVLSVRQQCPVIELSTKGPGGMSGVAVCALPPTREPPKRAGYYPDFQAWTEVNQSAGLWLGIDREQPPTPDDLTREGRPLLDGRPRPLHSGYRMALGGHAWCVPTIRRPPSAIAGGRPATELPEDLGWDAAGNFVRTLKPDYRAIWNDAGELIDLFFDEEGRHRVGTFELPIDAALAWAVRILSLNYRFDRYLQSVLHPIDGASVWSVLGAAIDAPLVWQLSLTTASANIPRGETGGRPATDPAAGKDVDV